MANEKDYIPEGSGPNGEFQEGDDLKEESKITLASFMTQKAQENNEAFRPRSGQPLVETRLTDGNHPAEFQTGGEDQTVGFTKSFSNEPQREGGAVANFETLSDSGKFTLGSFMDKNSQASGHNLLRNIKSNFEPGEPGIGDTTGATAIESPPSIALPEVQRQISSILSEGNRFDPIPGSSPYIEDGKFTDPGIPITQGEFGVYSDSAERTTIKQLHNVAKALMVKQTGERLGKNKNPDGGEPGLFTPSGVQMGSDTLNAGHTLPRNAFGAPDIVEVANGELRYNDIDGKALRDQKSFGVLNSYREEFEHGRIQMLTVALLSFLQYLLAASMFVFVLDLVNSLVTGKPDSDPSSPTTLKKGENRPKSSLSKLLIHLGVPDLKRPFWLCMIFGIGAFFGLPKKLMPKPDGSDVKGMPKIPGFGKSESGFDKIIFWFATTLVDADIGKALVNAAFGGGYYANMMRVQRRDVDRMLSDIDLTDIGSGIMSLFNLLLSLNSYNSWTFFTTLLKMGDIWIDSYQPRMTFGELQANGQTRQVLSRQNAAQNDLAWRHRSAPALVLLNEKYQNAMTAFGYHQDQASTLLQKIGDPYSRSPKAPYNDSFGRKGQTRGTYKGNKTHRFTREEVMAIENELDSEYCPFYFHDLITNEVMGFHAFLSDVKDSYSVNYAESGGYGRIDKVKIYQDTTRSINVSWTMVATSPADFDSMWYSVNKLVNLIYPQFSMGKAVTAGDKKFVMPFSQIPTSTPVIRLRVGDIVRSNYSRFNLARLFGLSEIKPATKENAGSAAVISSAPFDITAGPARESARAKAAAEDRKKYEEQEDLIKERFAILPSSPGDTEHGFVPGSELWGEAILKPSSAGYLTFDTGPGKLVTIGTTDVSNAKNVHVNNKPAKGAIKVSTAPFKSRPATSGHVKIFERIILTPSDLEASGVGVPDGEPTDGADLPSAYPTYFVQYVDQDDTADPYHNASEKKHFHTYVVTQDALEPIVPEIKIEPTSTPDPTISLSQQITDIGDFFAPENNAIVRSFEAAGGRGLAGVITSFDMDWAEAQWDMSSIGRRAPTMIKCSIAFSPIHDIVPGLDNNGMPRAMNYPVGNIAGPLGTDFYDPGGIPGDAPGRPTAKGTPSHAGDLNMKGFAASKNQGGEGGG